MKNIFFLCLIFISSITIQAQWLIPADLIDQVDAAVYSKNQESVLFFASDILVFNSFFQEEQNKPISIHEIPNLPKDWGHIDAAMAMEANNILLFNGHNYCEYDLNTQQVTSQSIWEGLPAEWDGRLDAAVEWDDNNYLFFLGYEYIVYDAETGKYGELDLIVNWEGWPTEWEDGFSSAANIGDGNVYFFRGQEFLAFNLISNEFVGPISMNSGFVEAKK